MTFALGLGANTLYMYGSGCVLNANRRDGSGSEPEFTTAGSSSEFFCASYGMFGLDCCGLKGGNAARRCSVGLFVVMLPSTARTEPAFATSAI